MTLVAGVDSSTQSCKVVIVDATSGEIVREGRATHPDGTEVDPSAWWSALCEAVEQAGGLADVQAISIGGQQHGLVALDTGGRVVRDALLWNDTRSANAAADLIAEVGSTEYARRTGSVPVASFTATKLRWVRDNEQALAARIAAVCLPHDWLTWRLRGFGPVGESVMGPNLEQLVTDRSDASGTAYWSILTEGYDFELFERALGRPGVEANPQREASAGRIDDAAVILPRVMRPQESTLVEAAAPELMGVNRGLVVGPGAGDNAALMLALDAHPGDVVMSIGTSGTVIAVSPEPVADFTGTVAGFADASGAFLALVATLNAAKILDATARLLGVDHVALADLAVSAEPGSGGLSLLPYFEGERTPNLPNATAAILGMTLLNTSAENLARAAVEGMMCGLADGLDAIQRLGHTPTRLLLVGGGAKSRAVPQVASEVLGLQVMVPEFGEYVAIGAAKQAAWVLLGNLPEWPLALAMSVNRPAQPHIRANYHLALKRQVENATASSLPDREDSKEQGKKRFPASVYSVGKDPDPRFTFANERTFLAWIRTSLAFMAAGVALEAFGFPENAAFRSSAALAFIVIGVAAAIRAWTGWAKAERALRLNEFLPALGIGLVVVVGTLITISLVVVGVIL
jgi:xylulokinase